MFTLSGVDDAAAIYLNNTIRLAVRSFRACSLLLRCPVPPCARKAYAQLLLTPCALLDAALDIDRRPLVPSPPGSTPGPSTT